MTNQLPPTCPGCDSSDEVRTIDDPAQRDDTHPGQGWYCFDCNEVVTLDPNAIPCDITHCWNDAKEYYEINNDDGATLCPDHYDAAMNGNLHPSLIDEAVTNAYARMIAAR